MQHALDALFGIPAAVHVAGTIYERDLPFFDELHSIRRITLIFTAGDKNICRHSDTPALHRGIGTHNNRGRRIPKPFLSRVRRGERRGMWKWLPKKWSRCRVRMGYTGYNGNAARDNPGTLRVR